MSTRSDIALVVSIASALSVVIYILISVGGLVRSAGAGLACPDWPLCYGQLVPAQLFNPSLQTLHTPVQVFFEWFHRLIAGSISVGILILSFLILRKKELRQKYGKFCFIAMGLLLSQVLLGGMTVLGLLSPKWVVSHLAVGLAFFATVLWLTLSLRRQASAAKPKFQRPQFMFRFALGTSLLLYIQMILGGLVSSNYAGLACPDFPTCQGAIIPQPFVGGVALQTLHRFGALASTFLLVFFTVFCLKEKFLALSHGRVFSGRITMGTRVLPALLSFQIALGVGMIWFKLPLLMSVAHLATATAIFGFLLVMVYEFKFSARQS